MSDNLPTDFQHNNSNGFPMEHLLYMFHTGDTSINIRFRHLVQGQYIVPVYKGIS